MARMQFCSALLLTVLASSFIGFQTEAAPAGSLIKHLSKLVKWSSRPSSKTSQTDGSVIQFEDGYLTETVVEGNGIGIAPYKIRVSGDGELYAVDAVSSNVVQIASPLSQYSRGRLLAGSSQGQTGHVDGKPDEARFNHPMGVTMDDKGNLYVADTLNLAIRRIGDMGVTTLAGGKSNAAGYRDGPSEDAEFSSDFDVFYVHSTCCLLVVDRGNAAIRQIRLNQEDCDQPSKSNSWSDVLSVVGAIVAGYVLCLLQLGIGPSKSPKTHSSEHDFEEHINKTIIVTENSKEEPRWPSFGQLLSDLSKLSVEALGSVLLYLIPSWFRSHEPQNGLTPLKDKLRMPEDDEPVIIKKQDVNPMRSRMHGAKSKDTLRMPEAVDQSTAIKNQNFNPVSVRSQGVKDGLTPLRDKLRMPEDDVPLPVKKHAVNPIPEAHNHTSPTLSERYLEMKPPKIKSGAFKDPALLGKHRPSKRQEYAEFYGSGEVNSHGRVKSYKEKTRHRQRDKSGEIPFSSSKTEAGHSEVKHGNFDDPKYGHYNARSKYQDDSYRYP